MSKTTVSTELPKHVYVKNNRYYLVVRDPETGKQPWVKLTQVKEGDVALQAALARLQGLPQGGVSNLSAIIAAWEHDEMKCRVASTQSEDVRQGKVIAAALGNLTVGELTIANLNAFLKRFDRKSRTFNIYRARLNTYIRYAISSGAVDLLPNPCDHIRTKKCLPRTRYITDAELQSIKAVAKRSTSRAGRMLCAVIDMAYLTGQRVGDLRSLKWSQVTDEGIEFDPSKLDKSTRRKITLGWTPELRAVVQEVRELQMMTGARGDFFFTTTKGTPLTKHGFFCLWSRTCKMAGVEGATFHDLRAKAITDVVKLRGLQAGKAMGAHSSEGQTLVYVRNHQRELVMATR